MNRKYNCSVEDKRRKEEYRQDATTELNVRQKRKFYCSEVSQAMLAPSSF